VPLTIVCFYFYGGSDNVCANSPSLVFLAWGFKIFYAIGTDRWRPFGSRRRVYMTWGWIGAIGCTVILAIFGDDCTVEFWLAMSIATQAFMMLADVPADGKNNTHTHKRKRKRRRTQLVNMFMPASLPPLCSPSHPTA
jgi:hypothetical protein